MAMPMLFSERLILNTDPRWIHIALSLLNSLGLTNKQRRCRL